MSILDSASSFEELDKGYRNKISKLQICSNIRGGWGEDSFSELSEAATELSDISQEIINHKKTIQHGRKYLAETYDLLQVIRSLQARLDHMTSNMPNNLPSANSKVDPVVATTTVQEGKELPATSNKLATAPVKSKPVATVKIEFITVEEFESVPKYIRGRHTYEQVNQSVTEINKTLETKYVLLSKPRSKLTTSEMKLVTTFKQQLSQETKGVKFIVDNDIKRWSNLKMDTSGRNLITVLRTLKRLREIRGPGQIIRYAVL